MSDKDNYERKVIKSTSLYSADCPDVELRKKSTTRLLFRPEIVENPKNAEAAVRGTFIFQRKGIKDEWEDAASIPFTKLKKGEGYRLELRSEETLTLFKALDELYKFQSRYGVPIGKTELVRVNSVVSALSKIPNDELRKYLTAHRSMGDGLLSSFLSWAADVPSPEKLVPRLVSLGANALRNLNVAFNIRRLKNVKRVWVKNAGNGDEEFWQKSLTENSFVLEQVFSWPITIVKGKVYVGGSNLLKKGGKLADFLVKRKLTDNAALIEIKTPKTNLLGNKYREGVYNPSKELSGSVMQVLNYKHHLQKNIRALTEDLPGRLEAIEPQCVVIIGNAKEVVGDSDKKRSFELFRSMYSTATVITFDELFEKTERLIHLLESAGD
jgi:hypothetical protein